MIRIKCGTCGTSQGYKTQADGAFSLPVSEEARLVSRGVAAYMTEPIIGADLGIVTPAGAVEGGEAGENSPEEEEHAEGLEAPEGDEAVCLNEAQLMAMELKDLKVLAAELGVNTRGLRSRGDYAKAIAAVKVEPGEELEEADGEDPPELSPEEPVE